MANYSYKYYYILNYLQNMRNVYGLTLRTGKWVLLWLSFRVVLSFLHTAKKAFFAAEYRTVNTSSF
jgi:hypothetical protein